MIIGVSGKIGSGKDTVGKIIQYLIWEDNFNKTNRRSLKAKSFTEVTEHIKQENCNLSKWEVRKFADKLKDIVCLLIGCSREDLENHEFKNSELGEEWWLEYLIISKTSKYYRNEELINTNTTLPRIYKVLITSGKSIEVYKDYEEERDLKQIEKWKEESKSFNSSDLIIETNYETELVKLTPRKVLQLLGTDCGRDIIHPNIWVNSLFSEYKAIGDYPIIKGDEYIRDEYVYPNWIITDMRFLNELKAIEDKEGITIRINRLSEYEKIQLSKIRGGRPYDKSFFLKKEEHESETALDNVNFKYTIDNNGSIEELVEKVKEILIKENII